MGLVRDFASDLRQSGTSDGLRLALENLVRISVPQETRTSISFDGDEAHLPDYVRDVEMPVMGVQAAMRRMSRSDPPAQGRHSQRLRRAALVRELVEQGASAYLPNTASLRELVAAVRAVSRDEGGKVLLSLPSETLERVDRPVDACDE